MATLFNTKISDTYQGLIKTLDNGIIGAVQKELTDGAGNQTGLFLDNLGNFKVTNNIQFGNLKDISNIEISKFITSTDGIENFANNTSVPTTLSVKNYVDSSFTAAALAFSGNSGSNGSIDLDSQVFYLNGLGGISTTVSGTSVIISGSTLESAIGLNTTQIGLNVTAIALNTAKVGITPQQASDITTNNAKTGITSSQAADIVSNTAKVGITSVQASDININNSKVGYTDALVSANSDVVANTAKVGITTQQASDIEANNLKDGISASQISEIDANTLKVGYTEALVSANSSVVANTAKVGITPAQSTAITTNTTNITNNFNEIVSNTNDISTNVLDIIDINNNISTINSTAEFLANKGQASGYVPLDANGKILEQYLPASIIGQLSYVGTWNANTDNPTLPNPTTVNGNYYIVSTAGTYLSVSYEIGDWIVSNGIAWQKIDNTDDVKTVFGRIGNILAVEADYNAFYPTLTNLPNLVSNNSAVAANTLKTGITSQQASDITANNAKVGYTDALVSSNYDVSANTAKVGITTQQANDINTNNFKTGITLTQANNITTNNAKVGITSQQANDISTNNSKVGITSSEQSQIIANTSKVGITSQQSADIITNNSKVGITSTQANNITTNNSKISFDSTSSTRLANTSGTNTGDQDLSNYVTTNTTQTISGTKTFTSPTTIDGGVGVNTSGGTLIIKQKGNGAGDGIAITSAAAASHRIWKASDGKFHFGSSSQTTAFTQLLDGSVGIGTDSPLEKLEVQGSIYATPIAYSSNQDAYALRMGANSSTAFDMGIKIKSTSGGSPYMSFKVPNNEDSIVLRSGNVGIGTSDPQAQLNVVAGNTVRTWTPTSGTSAIFESSNSSRAFVSIVGANQSELLFGDAGSQFSGRVRFNHSDNKLSLWASGGQDVTVDNSGNVGIGTDIPSHELTVQGSSSPNIELKNTNYSNGGFVLNRSNYGQQWKWWAQSGLMYFGYSTDEINYTNHLTIKSNGYIGIGNTPSYQLQLSTNSAAKPSSSLWIVVSDERVKENIKPYEKGLNEILQVNTKTFDYNGKAGFDKIKDNVGIIAQDMIKIFPETIKTYNAKLNETDEEETELYNFDGHALTFALINSVKELKAEIEELKKQIRQ